MKLIFFFPLWEVLTVINLHDITRARKVFNQITSFVSDNFTKISEYQMLHALPDEIHSFDIANNQKQFYGNTFEMRLKNMYSLVVFYTSNSNETRSFIDFITNQLSIGQRSKRLVIYAKKSESIYSEVSLEEKIFRFHGHNNVTNSTEPSSSIYRNNPFEKFISQKK